MKMSCRTKIHMKRRARMEIQNSFFSNYALLYSIMNSLLSGSESSSGMSKLFVLYICLTSFLGHTRSKKLTFNSGCVGVIHQSTSTPRVSFALS